MAKYRQIWSHWSPFFLVLVKTLASLGCELFLSCDVSRFNYRKIFPAKIFHNYIVLKHFVTNASLLRTLLSLLEQYSLRIKSISLLSLFGFCGRRYNHFLVERVKYFCVIFKDFVFHFFKNWANTVLFLFIFVLFKHKFHRKNCRRQRNSNSDRRRGRWACWPLDHHHRGPRFSFLFLLNLVSYMICYDLFRTTRTWCWELCTAAWGTALTRTPSSSPSTVAKISRQRIRPLRAGKVIMM